MWIGATARRAVQTYLSTYPVRHTIARVEYWGEHLGLKARPQDLCSNRHVGCRARLLFKYYGYEARLFFKCCGAKQEDFFSNVVVQSKTFVQKFCCEARFLFNAKQDFCSKNLDAKEDFSSNILGAKQDFC